MSNSKGFTPNPNRSNNTAQAATQHQTQDSNGSNAEYKQPPNRNLALNLLAEDAKAAVAGAKAAEMPYVAEAISRQESAFQSDTDAIANTLAVLLDPRAKLLAAYVKAADMVKDKPDFLPIPKGGYSQIMPDLPMLSDFASYYSVSQHQSAPQLGASGNNENQEPQTASSTGKPESEKI